MWYDIIRNTIFNSRAPKRGRNYVKFAEYQ